MRFKLHATLSVVSTHTHTHTHTQTNENKNQKTKHKKQNKKNIIWAKVKHVFVHLDATLY